MCQANLINTTRRPRKDSSLQVRTLYCSWRSAAWTYIYKKTTLSNVIKDPLQPRRRLITTYSSRLSPQLCLDGWFSLWWPCNIPRLSCHIKCDIWAEIWQVWANNMTAGKKMWKAMDWTTRRGIKHVELGIRDPDRRSLEPSPTSSCSQSPHTCSFRGALPRAVGFWMA